MRCLKILGPQMNANERKFYFGGFTKYSVDRQSSDVSSVSIFENNINYSRSFAFICGK
jgi:hypothetical protein